MGLKIKPRKTHAVYGVFGYGRFIQRRHYLREVREDLQSEGLFRVPLPWKTLYFGRGVTVVVNTIDNPMHTPEYPGVHFTIRDKGDNEKAKRIWRKIEDIVSEGKFVRLEDI